MWLSRRKVKEIVNADVKGTNVGKLVAKINCKNGEVFEVIEHGFKCDGFYRKADMDLFFSRREKNGYLKLSENTWIPREEIKSINVIILDHEV